MIDPVDNVTELLPVMSEGPILRRFASTDGLYAAMLITDLFGDWVLMQSWGSRFNQRGGGMPRPVDKFEAGMSLLAEITKRRQKRGYQLAA